MECLPRPTKHHTKGYKHNNVYDNHAATIPNDVAIKQLNTALQFEDNSYYTGHMTPHHLQTSINNNNNTQVQPHNYKSNKTIISLIIKLYPYTLINYYSI